MTDKGPNHYPSAPNAAPRRVKDLARSPDHEARAVFFRERSKRIQERGVRAADGVTFGKAKKER